MATRTPLREATCSRAEPSHGLLDWAEETGLGPEGEPAEGVPWHAVLLIVVGLALLIGLEIALAFGVAKLVTGHAY
jgi:hypothetical protein